MQAYTRMFKMKKTIYYIVAVATMTLLAACDNSSTKPSDNQVNESSEGPKFAYVNVDSLQNGLDYFKEKSEEFSKEQSAISNELEKLQREIQNVAASVQRKIQANDISPAEMEKSQKRIENLQINLQRKSESLSAGLMKKQAEFNEVFTNLVNTFFDEYGKKHGYDFIFTDGPVKSVFYKKPAYNITSSVTNELNDWINVKKTDQLLMKTLSNKSDTTPADTTKK